MRVQREGPCKASGKNGNAGLVGWWVRRGVQPGASMRPGLAMHEQLWKNCDTDAPPASVADGLGKGLRLTE